MKSLRCILANPHTNGDSGGKFRLVPRAPVLLAAHIPRGFAPEQLLDGVHNAFLDVTAQRLTDVQILLLICIVIARGTI
jgi:hypothetical protein